jgi:hypothetical protein
LFIALREVSRIFQLFFNVCLPPGVPLEIVNVTLAYPMKGIGFVVFSGISISSLPCEVDLLGKLSFESFRGRIGRKLLVCLTLRDYELVVPQAIADIDTFWEREFIHEADVDSFGSMFDFNDHAVPQTFFPFPTSITSRHCWPGRPSVCRSRRGIRSDSIPFSTLLLDVMLSVHKHLPVRPRRSSKSLLQRHRGIAIPRNKPATANSAIDSILAFPCVHEVFMGLSPPRNRPSRQG